MNAEGRRENLAPRAWTFQARFAPWLFLAPFLLLFAGFMAYPLLRSVVMSLYKMNGARAGEWVGLGHYRFFLTDEMLWVAVLNTVVYAVLIVGMQIPLSLGLAMLLNSRRVRFRGVFRFAF